MMFFMWKQPTCIWMGPTQLETAPQTKILQFWTEPCWRFQWTSFWGWDGRRVPRKWSFWLTQSQGGLRIKISKAKRCTDVRTGCKPHQGVQWSIGTQLLMWYHNDVSPWARDKVSCLECQDEMAGCVIGRTGVGESSRQFFIQSSLRWIIG